MKVDLFDKVLLKDGRTGFVVEVLNNGEAYMIEVDEKVFSDRLVTAKKEEIKKLY